MRISAGTRSSARSWNARRARARRTRGRGGTRRRRARADAPSRPCGRARRSRPGGRTGAAARSRRAPHARSRPASPSSELDALEREQPALELRAGAAVASDPVRGDDAVARDDERVAVLGAERPGRARGARPARERRQLAVGDDLAPRESPAQPSTSSRCSGVAQSTSSSTSAYDVGSPARCARNRRHRSGTKAAPSRDGSAGSVRAGSLAPPLGGADRAAPCGLVPIRDGHAPARARARRHAHRAWPRARGAPASPGIPPLAHGVPTRPLRARRRAPARVSPATPPTPARAGRGCRRGPTARRRPSRAPRRCAASRARNDNTIAP